MINLRLVDQTHRETHSKAMQEQVQKKSYLGVDKRAVPD